MDRIPTATDPTKITLAQATILALLAGVAAGWKWGDEPDPRWHSTLKALERRGLVRLLTQPNLAGGWERTWLGTDLAKAVLAGGLVHTAHERQADGTTRLLVFYNGRQAGEVKPVHGPAPSWRRAGWQGIDWQGVRSLIYPRKDMAVAYVAGAMRPQVTDLPDGTKSVMVQGRPLGFVRQAGNGQWFGQRFVGSASTPSTAIGEGSDGFTALDLAVAWVAGGGR